MWVSHEPSVSPTCWNWTHTLTSNTKRRLQKKLFNRQADCYSKGGRISPVGPDRKQVWKFWSIFLFKFDLFILKTHFISLWGVSKKHFPCPLCLHFTAIRPFCESQIVTEQQQTVRGFVIENSFKKFHLVFRITSPKGSLEKRILYSQSGLKHCIKPFVVGQNFHFCLSGPRWLSPLPPLPPPSSQPPHEISVFLRLPWIQSVNYFSRIITFDKVLVLIVCTILQEG